MTNNSVEALKGRPLLEYNSTIWSPRCVYLKDKLESVQRRFTKLSVILPRPAGHEGKAEAEVRKNEDEAEAQNFFSRPRPDTLENNSVCMSIKF